MNVLLIDGSAADSSHTAACLDYLAEEFEANGADTTVCHLGAVGLPKNDPKYHADAMKSPEEKVREFAQTVKDSDIVVLGTPLYHGSFSGLLKSALDNLDGDALKGKKVVLMSNASGLRNSMQAAQALVIVARTMEGDVYHRIIGTAKSDYSLNEDNEIILTDESIKTRCSEIAKEVLA